MYRIAAVLVVVSACCPAAVVVSSFQLQVGGTRTRAVGVVPLSTSTQFRNAASSLRRRTNSRLFEAAASSPSSAASKWMEEEKRLEDEMDEQQAVNEESTTSNNANDGTSNNPTKSNSNNNEEEEADRTPHSTSGRWESLHGNYILRPPPNKPPRALIHFLGGALLGAAPQLSYRYMLERLSSRGYLVVATPYQLSFDHLQTCDEIVGRFELVAPDLAKRELLFNSMDGCSYVALFTLHRNHLYIYIYQYIYACCDDTSLIFACCHLSMCRIRGSTSGRRRTLLRRPPTHVNNIAIPRHATCGQCIDKLQ